MELPPPTHPLPYKYEAMLLLLLLYQLLPDPQHTKFGMKLWGAKIACIRPDQSARTSKGEAGPGAIPSCISARYWAEKMPTPIRQCMSRKNSVLRKKSLQRGGVSMYLYCCAQCSLFLNTLAWTDHWLFPFLPSLWIFSAMWGMSQLTVVLLEVPPPRV